MKAFDFETVPDAFVMQVDRVSSGIYSGVLDLISQLELDASNNIILNANNLRLIEEIGTQYNQIAIREGYLGAVTDFARGLDAGKLETVEFFRKSFDDFENKAIYDLVYSRAKATAVQLVSDAALIEQSNILRELLQNSIAQSDSFNNLVKNIKTAILGNDQLDPGLVRYAKQQAYDSYSITQRSYANTVANDLGVMFYEYAGGEMRTTRCFCDKRVGKVYHKKEIEAWGRGENIGECRTGNGWAGRAAGTNESTIFNLVGGYNCKHSLIPRSIVSTPTYAITNALEKGWLKREDLPASVLKRLK